MKKILYLAVFALLSSCLTEKNAEPGKPSTFVRYFNGGNSDNALVSEETADGGIIILATTKIVSATDSLKVKLIKTDNYGNLLVQKLYPKGRASKTNLSGNTLLQLAEDKGFMVIGTQTTATRKEIFVMEVDSKLDSIRRVIPDFTPFGITESIQGRAIQLNSSGNYLILGAIVADTDNMLLAELDKTSLSIKWVKKYGAGKSNLSNKIFLDASNNVFWSGTVIRNSSDVRLVKTTQNSLNTIFDLPIGKSDREETGNDICRYGFGFAVVGSTNEVDVAKQDILFKILAEDGSVLFNKPFGFSETDIGNSITTARGGLVILGSTIAPEDIRRGEEDYYLIKVDAFGNEVWSAPRVFGSKSKDTGASVRQMSDGSLLILGTTVFGNVNTIMLMKANSEGKIE
jgi:hypothetical protein